MDHNPVTATVIEDFFIEKLNFEKKTGIPKYVNLDNEDDEDDEEVFSDDELEMDEQ